MTEVQEINEALTELLSKYVQASEDSPHTWESHDEAVEAADEGEEEEVVDLSEMSLVDKLGGILHEVANSLLTGEIGLENGQETLAFAQAVAIREQLKNSSCHS